MFDIQESGSVPVGTIPVPDAPVPVSGDPPPPSVPLERLEAQICELAGHLTAATCRFLVLLADFDARRGRADTPVLRPAHRRVTARARTRAAQPARQTGDATPARLR